jgi:hypothetical protein
VRRSLLEAGDQKEIYQIILDAEDQT